MSLVGEPRTRVTHPPRIPPASRIAVLALLALLGALPVGCIGQITPEPSTGEGAVEPTPRKAPDGPEHDGSLHIHFFDVGQGDAALIRSPGGQNVLIDAGPANGGVVDRLQALGVDTVHLLIASHNHADHIGGVSDVLRTLPVRFFMDNGIAHTTVTYRRMLETLAELDIPLLEPERRIIGMGEGTELEILPPPGDAALGHNDNSLGVTLRFFSFHATFAGDAESHLWDHWLREPGTIPSNVQLHKASHHGSRNGDTSEALARLRPELVVVSAGRGNPYGHPHAQALARSRAVGAAVLVTAERGTIRVAVAPDGTYEVRTAFGEGIHAPTGIQ